MIDTYDATAALNSIDTNVVAVLAFFAIAAVATFVYLVQSFKLARAHEAYSSALPAVGWKRRRVRFVCLYELWFEVYDHWWVKAWWVALVFTTIIEFALVGMIVKYGRREIAPFLTQRQFLVVIGLGTVAIGVIWLLAKAALDDPLFLISFPITAFWAVPFSTALMLRRQSAAGQSLRRGLHSRHAIPRRFGDKESVGYGRAQAGDGRSHRPRFTGASLSSRAVIRQPLGGAL